ncbi:MAG: prepilin-type N-terminal cleavage/methylation domain-containing protein [Proteobacteria bacterium]|nr:prepilin-type N-terminal cleavage/methylation domain-containing protein [Pseudomonadota bacterium]
MIRNSFRSGGRAGHGGFTLLEIIITITVAAILSAALVQLVGTASSKTTEPVLLVQEGYALNEVMERITADYKDLVSNDATPLQTLASRLAGGQYGTYTVTTSYVAFQSGSEVADGSGANLTLKVTITRGDQSLIALFTQ